MVNTKDNIDTGYLSKIIQRPIQELSLEDISYLTERVIGYIQMINVAKVDNPIIITHPEDDNYYEVTRFPHEEEDN